MLLASREAHCARGHAELREGLCRTGMPCPQPADPRRARWPLGLGQHSTNPRRPQHGKSSAADVAASLKRAEQQREDERERRQQLLVE